MAGGQLPLMGRLWVPCRKTAVEQSRQVLFRTIWLNPGGISLKAGGHQVSAEGEPPSKAAGGRRDAACRPPQMAAPDLRVCRTGRGSGPVRLEHSGAVIPALLRGSTGARAGRMGARGGVYPPLFSRLPGLDAVARTSQVLRLNSPRGRLGCAGAMVTNESVTRGCQQQFKRGDRSALARAPAATFTCPMPASCYSSCLRVSAPFAILGSPGCWWQVTRTS